MSNKIAAAIKNLEKANIANKNRYALRPKTYFTCKSCGIATICKPSHLPKKSYCSMRCMALAYSQRLNGKTNPNFKNAGRRACAACGGTYKNYDKRRKYCSLECYQQSGVAAENSRMNGRKSTKGGRADHNQAEIVAALRSVGASVLVASNQGGGFPDLVAGWRGVNYLLEVKNPNTSYGRSGFNKNQLRWNEEWRGAPPIIVRSPEDALAAIGCCLISSTGD